MAFNPVNPLSPDETGHRCNVIALGCHKSMTVAPFSDALWELRQSETQPALVSFFTAAEMEWRTLCQPFEPSLVIQFICSERR